MSDEGLEIKTRPRKAFDLNTPSTVPTTPNPETSTPNTRLADGSTTPARTRSILNLTSSTLFGIYRDTDYTTEREETSTPWGTGAETPVRKGSLDLLRSSIPEAFSQGQATRPKRAAVRTHSYRQRSPAGQFVNVVCTTLVLFGAGTLYGTLISHLHNRGDIVPAPVDLDHNTNQYLYLWGLAGVLLGNTLPTVDAFWSFSENTRPQVPGRSRLSNSWLDAVRSIGAIVGIALAIRKTSWTSTLQLSLTLACTNPALWWLIDRSVPGFVVSTIVAVTGTMILLLTNPDVLPAPAHLPTHIVKRMGENATMPAEHLVFGLWDESRVGSITWIASTLFCAALCLGNVGRRLAEIRK